jgi:hypothetical protein
MHSGYPAARYLPRSGPNCGGRLMSSTPAERLLGSDLEVEAQILGDDLPQVADPDADDRDRAPIGVALGRGDDRLGDGELVHLSSPR